MFIINEKQLDGIQMAVIKIFVEKQIKFIVWKLSFCYIYTVVVSIQQKIFYLSLG